MTGPRRKAPARRPSSRRQPRRRARHRGGAQWLLAAIAPAAALWWLAHLVAHWWPVLAVTGGAVLLVTAAVRQSRAAAGRARLAALRLTLAQLDALDPTAFEYAIRDLLARDGYPGRRVGGAGDAAADVIAAGPAGRLVVQCKHTVADRRVGVPVLYQVNGTAGPVHRADAAMVVTNGGFTRQAREFAATHRIALIDRDALSRWALGQTVAGFVLPLRAGARHGG
jgi:restriction system protein